MLYIDEFITYSDSISNYIKIFIAIIGFISIYLTFNNHSSKWIRIIFIILGTSGLVALLLFIMSGSTTTLGLYGTIGLVLSLHAIVLPQIRFNLNHLFKIFYNYKKYFKLYKKNIKHHKKHMIPL